jgi:hypothetical protein
MAIKVTDIDNTLLEKCYKFIYRCGTCKKKYGTDQEEKGRHLCPIHDLHFKDNKFRTTFAAKMQELENIREGKKR